MEPFALSGTVVQVLSLTIGVLFVVTAAFSIYAVVLRLAYERRNRLWARLSERWAGPVLTAIADPESASDIHELVTKDDELYFVNFVLDYHQRVRGEEQRILRELAEPYLEEIARRSTHRRTEVRMRSVQTLGALGLPKYRSVLEAALRDPAETVAVVAARSLAHRGRPELRTLQGDAFIEGATMILDAIPRFSKWAPVLLGSMVAELGADASPLIRTRLADGSAPSWLRTVHAIALRLQLDPRAADVAAEVLSELDLHGDHDDIDLASELLRLLGTVGRPEHVPAVTPWLDAPLAPVRGQAARALGVLGGEDIARRLVASLQDDSPWVAANAARGLLAAGGRRFAEQVAAEHADYAEIIGQAVSETEA